MMLKTSKWPKHAFLSRQKVRFASLQQMKIRFRVDAYLIMGTGNLMRCLTRVKSMVAAGAHCFPFS